MSHVFCNSPAACGLHWGEPLWSMMFAISVASIGWKRAFNDARDLMLLVKITDINGAGKPPAGLAVFPAIFF